MSYLAEHSSASTRILEVLFPNGAWRELVAKLAWELLDKYFESGETVSFRVWKFPVTVPKFIIEKVVTALFGARP